MGITNFPCHSFQAVAWAKYLDLENIQECKICLSGIKW